MLISPSVLLWKHIKDTFLDHVSAQTHCLCFFFKLTVINLKYNLSQKVVTVVLQSGNTIMHWCMQEEQKSTYSKCGRCVPCCFHQPKMITWETQFEVCTMLPCQHGDICNFSKTPPFLFSISNSYYMQPALLNLSYSQQNAVDATENQIENVMSAVFNSSNIAQGTKKIKVINLNHCIMCITTFLIRITDNACPKTPHTPSHTQWGLRSHSGGTSVWRHGGHDPIWTVLFFNSVTHRPQTEHQPVYCSLSCLHRGFPVHHCTLCAKTIASIKSDGEFKVRKGKEMYKQKERMRDKVSDKKTVRAAEWKMCYRLACSSHTRVRGMWDMSWQG